MSKLIICFSVIVLHASLAQADIFDASQGSLMVPVTPASTTAPIVRQNQGNSNHLSCDGMETEGISVECPTAS